jgi:hypothetical protein
MLIILRHSTTQDIKVLQTRTFPLNTRKQLEAQGWEVSTHFNPRKAETDQEVADFVTMCADFLRSNDALPTSYDIDYPAPTSNDKPAPCPSCSHYGSDPKKCTCRRQSAFVG